MKASAKTLVVLCFLAALPRLAQPYSSTNASLSRSFDRDAARPGEPITVTVSFNNDNASAARGVYYAEHIPAALAVTDGGVTIDGNVVSGYALEIGATGDVYPGFKTYRWIIETPSAFAENNPVAAGEELRITYSVTASVESVHDLEEFHWVAYIEGSGGAFGYSEAGDAQAIVFGAPDVSVSPPGEIDFGSWDVAGGPTTSETLQIANNGAVELNFTTPGIALSGGDAADFAFGLSATTGSAIAAGGDLTVEIVFDPTTSGTKITTLTITTDDADESTITVPLTGYGDAIASAYCSPTSLNFDAAYVGTTSSLRTMTIESRGSLDLTFTTPGISLSGPHSGDFLFASESSTATLPAGSGSSVTVSLIFHPTATGQRTANLAIATNDPNSPTTISLTGLGMPESSGAAWRQY